jgi:light-regulated signal transduction histidine kinase (bacteriophytochrome)
VVAITQNGMGNHYEHGDDLEPSRVGQATTKQIVQAHGGQIKVESTVGGTKVTVTSSVPAGD